MKGHATKIHIYGRSVINVARVIELTASDVYEVKGQLADEDIAAISRARAGLDLRASA